MQNLFHEVMSIGSACGPHSSSCGLLRFLAVALPIVVVIAVAAVD